MLQRISNKFKKPPSKVLKMPDADVYFAPNCGISKYALSRDFHKVPLILNSKTIQRDKPDRDVQKGPIVDGVPLCVTRNDAGTTLHAMAKRLDVKPNEHVGEITLLGYKKLLSSLFKMETIIVDKPAMDNWLSSLPIEKRERMQKLLHEPRYWQANTRAEVFAKAECHFKEPGSDGRVIHCYDDEANLEYGCVTNMLNDRLCQQLSEKYQTGIHKVYYPGGKSDQQVATLRANQSGDIIEGDYSNQDATHPVQVRKLNACVFKKLGAPEWWLREYLTQDKIKAFSRQLGVLMNIEGQNHSGECMVTINNVCLNAANNLGAAATITPDNSMVAMVYGDDTEIYTSGDKHELASTIKKAAEQTGMSWKVAFPDRRMATFLQTRVSASGPDIIPVPKLGRILARLNVRVKANAAVSDQDYMAGKYLSAAYKTRFLPNIRDTLISVADTLSDKPYVEREAKNISVADMRKAITTTGTIQYDVIAREAIMNIYGCSIEDVNHDFVRAGIGCIRYLRNQPGMGKVASALKLEQRNCPSDYTGIESSTAKYMCLLDT